jgi:hypothetical protein
MWENWPHRKRLPLSKQEYQDALFTIVKETVGTQRGIDQAKRTFPSE